MQLKLPVAILMMPEQREKKDDWEGNSQQPKKSTSSKAHSNLHNCLLNQKPIWAR